MFARKIQVQYEQDGRLTACPLKWLDSFAMRSFTNEGIFDDTLPVSDGVIEIGNRVPLDHLQKQMEDWFERKCYISKSAHIHVKEL